MPQGNYVLTVTPQNDREQKETGQYIPFSVNPAAATASYIEVERLFSVSVLFRVPADQNKPTGAI